MESAIVLPLLTSLGRFATLAASTVSLRSPLRTFWCLFAVGINVACFFAYDQGSPNWIKNRITRVVHGSGLASEAWSSFERLVCSQWNLEAGGPERYCQEATPASKSLYRYTLNLLFNPRGIGTPWQTKGVPQFSNKDPKYVPSRTNFLKRRALSLVCCVLVVDLCGQLVPSSTTLYSLEALPVFRRRGNLAVDMVAFRLISTIVFWLQSGLGLVMTSDAASLVAVGTNMNDPQDWPPLIGSPVELYTIRNFWGTVWHQMLRPTLEGVSNFLTHDILHIPHKTLLARYLKIWIAFFISGSIHAGLAEEHWDIRGSGTVRFFCTQTLGIVLENSVQQLWERFTGRQSNKSDGPLWRKIVGLVWLLAFMSWSTPVLSYRLFQYESPGIDYPLGFSVIAKYT